jgi:O-antigen ligase
MAAATEASSPARDALDRGLERIVWVAIAAAILSPLVINGSARDDAFFSPKWAWMLSWGAVGWGAAAGRAMLGRPMRLALDPICLAALLFFGLHVISTIWARSPQLAVERALHLAGPIAIAGLALQVVRSRRAVLNTAWLWLAVAGITALWTLRQDFIRAFQPERLNMISNLPDWRGYLAAGLGNTNHIGDYLALALLADLVFLGEARRPIARVASILGAVVLAAALTVVWSVGSNLGLLVGGATMLGLVFWRERWRFFRRRARWTALLAFWAAMLGFFFIPHRLNPHPDGLWREAFGSARWREGAPTRLIIWSGALEIARAHPILGVGAGNFTYAYPEVWSPLLDDRPELWVYRGQYTNAAHNVALQASSELGALGLLLLLFIIAGAFRSLLRGVRWSPRPQFLLRMTLAGLLAAWCAQGMMNFSLQQPSGALNFFLILAAVAIERRTRERSLLPSLVWMTGSLRLSVEWHSMRKPHTLGGALHLRPRVGEISALALLALGLLVAPFAYRPVAAQTAFGRADDFTRLRRQIAAMTAPDDPRAPFAGLEARLNRTRPEIWRAFIDRLHELASADPPRALQRLDGGERRAVLLVAATAEPVEFYNVLGESEELHLRSALELYPWVTSCRSRLSELLVEVGRPREAIEQLEITRRGLNSSELWEREARAWAMLGEPDRAAEAMRVFDRRLGRDWR